MACHDVDLVNDVATDIIEMHDCKLNYYPGNYDSYRSMKQQEATHILQTSLALKKKSDRLKSTLRHLKEQTTLIRGAKKKAKAIASHRRKMDWHKDLLEKSGVSSEALPLNASHTSGQTQKMIENINDFSEEFIQFE